MERKAAEMISYSKMPVLLYVHSAGNLRCEMYSLNVIKLLRYTMEEAIGNLKQLCHPSLMNEPDALVNIKIEFDMRASKKDRFLDGFNKTVAIVKQYERGVPDRNVLCFVPNEEMRIQALQSGAVNAGGHDLIMEISKGQVDIVSIK